MLISATSALVLNWTLKDVWQSTNALNYLNGLDLREGEDLYCQFDVLENHMLTQAVTNRKYFVRRHAVEFLAQCQTNHQQAQVIILAAGISPLSVELASLFPSCTIFDVDTHGMNEKKQYLKNICPNICFITGDITDIALLQAKLTQSGWKTSDPTLVVIEGIVYYLTESDLKNILRFFAGFNVRLIVDFVLKPEYVHEKTRIFGVEVFRKIKESVGLDFVNFYAPDYFMDLLNECGFNNLQRYTMDEIQLERTGNKKPFDLEDSGWVSMIMN